MTQQEILEYNERCLKILPFKYKNQSKYWVIYKYDDNSFFGRNRRDLAVNNLKFHSDWNWIMEVVEAIEKLRYLVVIHSNFCQIQEIGVKENNFKPYIITSLYGNDKKEAVVQAINQFLIWYNNELKKQ